MTPRTALIYGATGYMGRLCARRAVEAGLRPVLAARDAEALAAVAAGLGLPARAFGLDDARAVEAALTDTAVVLNCAGPFERTAGPLVDACLRTGTHYLDLAGEVPAFRQLHDRHEEAVRAGIVLLPGAGFGVVPTDCLAAHLHGRLPGAVHLEIAFQAVGGLSRGTAGTLLDGLPQRGVRRSGGRLVPQRAAERRLRVDFGAGPVTVTANPWRADLFTAGLSTGIAAVDAYTAVPAPMGALMRLAGRLPGPFASRPWRSATGALVRRLPAGPTDEQLAAGYSRVWARAVDASGAEAVATLHGPEAYEFSARTARLLMERVLAGRAGAGFRTPATAYGPDLVLEVAGVRRTDVAA
ncbi:saccharopine dehydrogenase NADP-binding domain-containing protein [Streptacidiphilus sp. ASG 303]|uniref:saccharopine dehydrogenase family protein n=1 Tax=Streptacidiphilus sp. ASG 303 TaxID=2896847 RepID=UPI001E4E48F8|nr:saccharopine dehydrogenase NADP-binding domain-containing protein [Streptacidiphilus sp. ASG 303]MCD0484085.1 saccharopine dehydrogenase NADP-binding domain-containing protein [Streptacidiphilus sp. ASG 303]